MGFSENGQICVHIDYKGCRKHFFCKTKPKPRYFVQFRHLDKKKRTYDCCLSECMNMIPAISPITLLDLSFHQTVTVKT